jgi:hypothetical protein
MTTAAIERELLSRIEMNGPIPNFKLCPLAGPHDSARKDTKEQRRQEDELCSFAPLLLCVFAR